MGQPIPWYTYSSIHFLSAKLALLDEHDSSKPKIFEFGSGKSTLWWSSRAALVVSVEDNVEWHSYVTQNKPANVSYEFANSRESYIEVFLKQESKFDLIVIDGSHRTDCIVNCFGKLSDKGIVIVDNSDWEEIKALGQIFEELNFRQLEFYGVGLRNGHPWGKYFFYRPNNFLEI